MFVPTNSVATERVLLRQQRIAILDDEICEYSLSVLLEDLLIMATENKEPINIIICSDGGYIFSCMGILKIIKDIQNLGIKVIGRVYGHALSAAFIILQACDERIMGKFCTLMAHGITTFTVGDMKDVAAETKLLKFYQKEMAKFIADRSTAKGTKYSSVSFWQKLLESNTPQYLNSDEALEMGLVDKVE